MRSINYNESDTNKISHSNLPEEVSLKDFLVKIKSLINYLWSRWLVISFFVILGAVIGFFYAYRKKAVYVAETSFVLEESGSGGGGLGQYAGIASMVGVDLGGGGGGIFQGDNLLELYKSRSMIEKTLLSPFDLDGKHQLLIDKYVDFNGLREGWNKKPELKNIKFNSGTRTRIQDSLIGTVVNDIKKNYLGVIKPDKKLSIINVTVKSSDEIFAKSFNDQIVKNVNDFYVQTKTKKSLENLLILQHQTDSIKRALNGAISDIASSNDVNPNFNPSRQVLKVPSQRRQVDAEANKAILTELVKNLELSKVSLRKETPLIQVIDEPVYPLAKDKLSKLIALLAGAFLFGVISVFVLLIRKVLKDNLG